DAVHLGRVTVEVHRHDAHGALGDRGLDRLRGEAEVVGVDVREDRRRTGQGYGVAGRGEGEGRHDDLVTGLDPTREQSEVQTGGARVDRDAAPAETEVRAELLLERLDLRALREHAAAQ